MPLPPNNTQWPPVQIANVILPKLGEWSAWYAGDPDQLSMVYGGQANMDPGQTGFFASDHGGFTAMGRVLKRVFWGEPTRAPDRRNKLHVPIAADLCQASADLLFADEVQLTAKNTTVQAAIDDMADDGLHSQFAQTAEVCAALGGAYLKVTWDENLADHPFLTTVDADQALPEFSWDRLTAVTFWQIVKVEGERCWRHLERHELDPSGVGIILHGLYQGDKKTLGIRVPFTEASATMPLVGLVDQNSSISTLSPGLDVFYIANQRPQRRWRTDPLGKSLGRSDLDGVESLMDALDETYSSWMRDLRLGKARVMVSKNLLEGNTTGTPGSGANFDNDQEIYAPVTRLDAKGDQPLSSQMNNVQFAIRYAEHSATAEQIKTDILRTAGYSSQTFGEGTNDRITTATEIESRERRSFLTRDRKIRLWRPVIAAVMAKMLLIDDAVFGTTHGSDLVEVAFADGVQETPLALANTSLALRNANAASTKTLVAMNHPDWDDEAVDAEVALIDAEVVVPDPNMPLQPGSTRADGTVVKTGDTDAVPAPQPA